MPLKTLIIENKEITEYVFFFYGLDACCDDPFYSADERHIQLPGLSGTRLSSKVICISCLSLRILNHRSVLQASRQLRHSIATVVLCPDLVRLATHRKWQGLGMRFADW